MDVAAQARPGARMASERLAWMPVSEDATVGSKHWVVTAARAMDSGKAKQPVLPRFRSCLLNEHHI